MSRKSCDFLNGSGENFETNCSVEKTSSEGRWLEVEDLLVKVPT
jgi:hypothetical protein